MPLDELQKRQLLIDRGYDPDKYELEEFDLNEGSKAEPTSNPVSSTPQITGTQAFTKSLGRNLFPGLSGLGAGAMAMKAMPFKHPAALLGAGLVGGIAGSMGADLGQEAILNKFAPGWQKERDVNLQAAETQHPVMSTVGAVAPGFVGVGPGGLGAGLKGLSKLPKALAGAKALTEGEKVALATAGLNTGIAGGLEAGQEVIHGTELDPTKIATTAIAGGLLQNKPWGLGKKLFPGLVETPEPTQIETSQPKPQALLPERTGPIITPPPTKPVKADPLGADYYKTKELLDNAPNISEEQKQIDSLRAELEALKGKELKPSLATDQNLIVKSGEPEANLQVDDPEFTPDPTTKFYQEDNTVKAIRQQLTDEQLAKANKLASTRGAKEFKLDESLVTDKGTPARGVMELETKQPIINPALAAPDTAPHEIGHMFFRQLEGSKDAGDSKLASALRKSGIDEENFIEQTGLRYNELENKPIRTWIGDNVNTLKRALGLEASHEDNIKLLARRLKDDRAFSDSPELLQRDVSPEISSKPVSVKYQEAGDHSPMPEKTKEPKPYLLKQLGATTDRVRETGPLGAKAAEAAERTLRDTTRYGGQFTEKLNEHTTKLDSKNNEAIARYIWESRGFKDKSGKIYPRISLKDKSIIDNDIHPILRSVVDEQSKLNYTREISPDPKYRGPVMIDPDVIKVLGDEGSSKAKSLKEEYITHQMLNSKDPKIKGSKVKATEMLNDYLRALSSDDSTTKFNALRKAEGSGLPFSWMDKNPQRLFKRYGDRIARDMAYHKHIESDPEVSHLFGEGKVEGKESVLNEDMQVLKRLLTGSHTRHDKSYDAAEKLTRALIMGPATGLRSGVSSLAQVLPYVPVRDLPKIAQAFGYLEKGLKDSLNTGVNKRNTLELSVKNDEALSTIADNFREWGNKIRNISGANWLESTSRAHTMALGDLMTRASLGRFKANNDLDALKFLKQFKDSEMKIEEFKKGNWTEDDISRMAANFVERVQGTYDARGLPPGLLEPNNPLYFIGSLSKWSIEKANVIKKDVFNPALKDGDYAPLLRYVLGTTLTGAAIAELNEVLRGGKKSQTPTVKEIQDKGGLDEWAHKFFELQSLAGGMGIVSDLFKTTLDLKQGIKPRDYSVPSLEIAGDITQELVNTSKAIEEGQDPLGTLFSFLANTLVNTFQLARTVNEASGNTTDEIERANKFRDKKVYDRMDGKKVPMFVGNTDKYGGKDIKDFKQAKTPLEGKAILDNKILPRLKDDPNKHSKLSGIKINSYQTMPNDPVERVKYYDYIVRTQGKTAADKLLEDKIRQDAANSAKSSMVPSY